MGWGTGGYGGGISGGVGVGSSDDSGSIAGSWGRTGYDPKTQGIQSGLGRDGSAGDGGESSYAESYASVNNLTPLGAEKGYQTYSDPAGNVFASNPVSGKMTKVGTPSRAGGTMTTAAGWGIGRGLSGGMSGVSFSEAFPGAYKENRFNREEAARQQFLTETQPSLKSAFQKQFKATSAEQGIAPAIGQMLGNLTSLERGRASELEESGFDVGSMRDLPGVGALGRMASDLGFDVDEYANPETALNELTEAGQVEYNEETGKFEDTGGLGRMTAGTVLSALTQFPGLARLAYGATNSIPAAMAAQKAAKLGASSLLGDSAKSSMQESAIGPAVGLAAPQLSGAVSMARGPGTGVLGMMNLASQLQAAGVRPKTDSPGQPMGNGNTTTLADALRLPQSEYTQTAEAQSPRSYGGFRTSPYQGNLANYYKMFV